MTSNDIQELLDGGLPDEVSAELLHKLSISPEHRTAFQQHLALRGAFERDRAESAMQPDEDAMVWAGIIGSVPPAAAPVAAGFGFWRMAATFGAIAALLVGAYVLGNGTAGQTTSKVALSNRALTLPALTTLFGALDTRHSGVVRAAGTGAPVQGQTAKDEIGTSLAAAAPRTVWRDRVVYRDRERVVYRDRAVGRSEGNGSESRLAQNRGGASVPNQPEETSVAPVSSSSSGIPFKELSSLIPSTPAASSATTSSASVRLDAKHTALNTLADGSSSTVVDADSPLLRDGFEVSYTERIGRLGALPQAEVNDPTYTTRSLGLGYRFADGTFGVGARIGNGTFPTVALEPTQRVRREGAQSRIDTLYVPTLEARSENTVELFVNARFPLWDRFALGVEVAGNRSTRHTRFGGDISALWFLTDRIGLQGGIGIGSYSYDLGSSRETLLEHGENVGVSDNALDRYEGTVVEGRYGVLVNF